LFPFSLAIPALTEIYWILMLFPFTTFIFFRLDVRLLWCWSMSVFRCPYSTASFLAGVRKAAKSDYYLRPVYPYVRPHGTRIPLNGFSLNLISEHFFPPKICLANSSFVTVWQELRVLHMKIHAYLWQYLDNSS
jgi:hypothetical protein